MDSKLLKEFGSEYVYKLYLVDAINACYCMSGILYVEFNQKYRINAAVSFNMTNCKIDLLDLEELESIAKSVYADYFDSFVFLRLKGIVKWK